MMMMKNCEPTNLERTLSMEEHKKIVATYIKQIALLELLLSIQQKRNQK